MKGGKEVVSKGSKLFHLGGEYWGDLVGQKVGASSCQEGLGASGYVTNMRDWVNLDPALTGVKLTGVDLIWVESISVDSLDFSRTWLWLPGVCISHDLTKV